MGVSLAALGSACYGLRYRFGASHRANARPPHASRTQPFDTLLYL
ncbi:MAG: hypothetical protein NZ455_06625 [Bacteroidia bacterium]|nr:hypothetical protein [Bacteroidia bacterium]MDW8345710.1 hypothetical protein [Bacteroidia bacterium]